MNAVELGQVVNELVTDIILGDDAPAEPFEVRMKPNFDTACWSYLPPHRIHVGDKCLWRAKRGLRKPQKREYLGRFLRHEMAHLRETERDMVKINHALDLKNIPFSLFNLFEDARIEHLDRKRTGLKFDWCEFEDVDEPGKGATVPPVHEFFLLIQKENEGRELRSEAVLEFYDRAIAAPSTMSLIPILEEWIEKFGREAPASRFSSELQTSHTLQVGGPGAEAFNLDTFKPGASPPEKPGKLKVAARAKSKLLGDERAEVDFGRAEKMAMQFLSLFGARILTVRSNEPSPRVSARHLEMDRPCYKRKVQSQAVAKKLCLIIDCSGSMDGAPIEDARLLAWALSYLAALGKIAGCLILSAIDNRGTAVSEVFDFPVSKDVVERIHAFGQGEGLNSAILSNQQKLAGADVVFVKTDGEIGDESINRHLVERQGIAVCGLYSGGVHNAQNMGRHFKRFFVRDSLDGLMDALIQSRLA